MPGEGNGEKPGFFRRGDSRAGRGSRGRGGEGVDGVGSWQGWVSAGALWRVSVGSALLGGWPARTGGDSPAVSGVRPGRRRLSRPLLLSGAQSGGERVTDDAPAPPGARSTHKHGSSGRRHAPGNVTAPGWKPNSESSALVPRIAEIIGRRQSLIFYFVFIY